MEEQKNKEMLVIKSGMSNDAAIGYVIMAMKSLKFKKEEIEKVVNELHYTFDMKTEEEATKVCYDPFKYDDIK